MMHSTILTSLGSTSEVDHSRLLLAFALSFLWFVELTCVKDRAFITVVLNSQFPLSKFGNYVNKCLQNRQLRKSYVSNCFIFRRFRIERAPPECLPKSEFNTSSSENNSSSLQCWVGYSLPCESRRHKPVHSCRVLLRRTASGTSHPLFVKIQKTSVIYRKSVWEW